MCYFVIYQYQDDKQVKDSNMFKWFKTICVFSAVLFSLLVTQLYAAEDKAVAVVIELVTKMQEEARSDAPDFSSILETYLDWDKIMDRVFTKARIKIRKKREYLQAYKVFKTEFKDDFKKIVIAKYSNAEYLNKFKKTEFVNLNNLQPIKKRIYIEVETIAKVDDVDWKLKWTLDAKSQKVTELTIEGGIAIFKTEQDQVSSAFQMSSEDIHSFKAALEKVKNIYRKE